MQHRHREQPAALELLQDHLQQDLLRQVCTVAHTDHLYAHATPDQLRQLRQVDVGARLRVVETPVRVLLNQPHWASNSHRIAQCRIQIMLQDNIYVDALQYLSI